ncbi:MAG: DUF58 domain-containing protein [Candidatus Heimdallarchaeota archaeon]|nr:DUF58 domain-containing protein [Candidatus Heimdallarchaeota archaeon]MBY8993227.1 DUF58 domain-containing protein [Candidatus Heimdallarchaeota archaeon]
MISKRGSFILFGGLFMISIGLALEGIVPVFDIVILFMAQPLAYGISDIIVTYFLLIGILMVIGTTFGYPIFRIQANTEGITVKRVLDKRKTFAGEYIHVKITIHNKGPNAIDHLEIYDAYPETMDLVLGENYLYTRINANSKAEFSYIVRTPVRGLFKIGPTKVIIHDRLGFYEEEKIKQDFDEVLVYPSYEDIKKLKTLGAKRQLGKMFGIHKTKLKGTGMEFWGIRDYYPEDAFRYIDWKAFSRTLKLQIREFETEKNIRVMVLLDTSQSMDQGLIRNTKLEFSIRAVVLLAHMAQERKDMIGLATFDSKVNTFIKPGHGTSQFNRILEDLAYTTPRGPSYLAKAVQNLIMRTRGRGLLLIITDLEGKKKDILDGVRKASAAGFDVIIMSPFGPFFEIQNTRLGPTEKALGEAIAEEYFDIRSRLSRDIQRYRAGVISVGPDDFLISVINEYIEAKRRGIGLV